MKIFLKAILAPIALLYGLAVKFRNWLFDNKILKSKEVDCPTICVGNLTVGGTGKTPHVEYLVQLLSSHFSVATLSRGYKRKSKGFLYVEPESTSELVGDEPLQLKTKFHAVTVAVDGNRVRGAQRIVRDQNQIDVIILDDAFQHRYIKPGYSILLTDYSNLITKDFFLPMGKLRDSLSEKKRADCIIVTKCPRNISKIEQQKILKELSPASYQAVYFTTLDYGNPCPVFPEHASNFNPSKETQTIAIAGIANPAPFFSYVEQHTSLLRKLAFPDHFAYSEKKINAIFEKLNRFEGNNKAIVTTEKDAVRLKSLNQLDDQVKRIFFYVPVRVVFCGEAASDFNHKIETYVNKSKGNHSFYKK